MINLAFKPHLQQFDRPVYRLTPDELREKYGHDAIYRMASNENPVGPSPKVVEVVQQLATDVHWYPAPTDLRLREALAESFGREGLTPDHFYTACSGFETLEFIARGFLEEGDEVIVSSPTFTTVYDRITRMQGAKLVDVPLDPQTFALDVDGLLDAITPQTRLLFLCSPNNPTGTIITAQQMERIMAGVPDHVLIVADEVYWQFVQREDYHDTLQYLLDGRNIIIVHSFSKTYGLAGLRIGYAITQPQIANYLSAMQRGFHQNVISLQAAIAAVHDQAHVQHVVEVMTAEREFVFQQLDRLDVKYWQSETHFFVFDTPMLADVLRDRMAEEFGVLVQSQSRLNMPYRVRASLSLRPGNQQFIKALETLLAPTR